MKKIMLTFCLLISCVLCLFSQGIENPLTGYLRNFQYQKALDFIETQEPTKDLLVQKALSYKALGNYRKAIEILQPLSQEYAADLQIKTELAICYESMAQRQQSVECYDDLIRLDSTNIYFKMQKADILYQQEEYEKALELYQYIFRKQGFTNAVKRSAQCFDKMNELDSAQLYYSMAWEADSTDSFAAANLINLNLRAKDYHHAMFLSDIYVKRDSTDKQINVLNGLAYYGADLYEESVPRFKRCYANGDTSLVVKRSLGIAYYSLNDSYEAQPLLESAFRQDSTDNNVLYCLAITCNDMGEHKKAIPYFLKLLDRTIPPDMTLYLYYRNLASAYGKGSHYQQAVDTYEKAIGYGNDNQKMNLYYIIGEINQYSLSDKNKALKYFRLYRVSLNGYLSGLQSKEDIEPEEITETKKKLKHLDSHISDLEKELSK